ncbi:hypothetical protein D187_009326 [Cystobacter fuscus DSM 2262]|uniref:Uncharacterized protein n=1 Tax=Cystobacter fuscus (strain ATCC 25194 / DSM 2262 / NBRC 100088 / M29) TaxID=1242864 RepID=S9NWP1_CYSF2|nr:hypothetical protein D187_009326 [Cystobacter fuscus DSM 2262]
MFRLVHGPVPPRSQDRLENVFPREHPRRDLYSGRYIPGRCMLFVGKDVEGAIQVRHHSRLALRMECSHRGGPPPLSSGGHLS